MKTKKKVKCGSGFIKGPNGSPAYYTKKGAQRLADRMAAGMLPVSFWNGVVADCGDYYRISVAGLKEK